MRLVLLSRAYCHLCDDMEAALRRMLADVELEIVDIDAPENAALEEAYGDAVPVLFAREPGAANEICRYHLDVERLTRALRG